MLDTYLWTIKILVKKGVTSPFPPPHFKILPTFYNPPLLQNNRQLRLRTNLFQNRHYLLKSCFLLIRFAHRLAILHELMETARQILRSFILIYQDLNLETNMYQRDTQCIVGILAQGASQAGIASINIIPLAQLNVPFCIRLSIVWRFLFYVSVILYCICILFYCSALACIWTCVLFMLNIVHLILFIMLHVQN